MPVRQPAHNLLQVAHIAGILSGKQVAGNSLVEVHIVVVREVLAQKMPRQRQDILGPLSEWRKFEQAGRDAVVEVTPKSA